MRVGVPRERFEAGDLPRVCVRTGQPADGTTEVRFDSTPGWTWILLLFGVLPFLIASWFATEHATGQLPVTRAVVRRYHLLRATSGLLTIGGLGAVLGAMLVDSPTMAWVGVIAVVVGAIAGVACGLGFVSGRVRPDRIELSRVHPAFAEAMTVS